MSDNRDDEQRFLVEFRHVHCIRCCERLSSNRHMFAMTCGHIFCKDCIEIVCKIRDLSRCIVFCGDCRADRKCLRFTQNLPAEFLSRYRSADFSDFFRAFEFRQHMQRQSFNDWRRRCQKMEQAIEAFYRKEIVPREQKLKNLKQDEELYMRKLLASGKFRNYTRREIKWMANRPIEEIQGLRFKRGFI